MMWKILVNSLKSIQKNLLEFLQTTYLESLWYTTFLNLYNTSIYKINIIILLKLHGRSNGHKQFIQ